MKDFLKKWVPAIRRVLTSWWFIGLIGWTVVAINYPLQAILPRYAG